MADTAVLDTIAGTPSTSPYLHTSPVLNIRLLREAVAWIEANPLRWHQSVFRDAPTGRMCLGGVALMLVYGEGSAAFGLGAYDRATRALGFSSHQACKVFGFISVYHPRDDGRGCGPRHPSLADLKARITECTGVTFE